MTKKRSEECVDFITTTHPLDAPPIHLSRLLADVGIAHLQMSKDAAVEFADKYATHAARVLQDRIDVDENGGTSCNARFNSSAADHVQGICFVEPTDLPEIRAAKFARLQVASYSSFLKKLSWREFEACSRGVLKLLGCDRPVLTRHGNDQGIDFFGELSLAGKLQNRSALPGIDRVMRLWIVGQAKKFDRSQVATPDIRELVGSVHLAMAAAFSDSGQALSELRIRACDPVYYLFMTTGSISRDGRRLIVASGMLAMDGEQVAAFLADNNIGEDSNGLFDVDIARTWISGLL